MLTTEEEAKTKWCPENRRLIQLISPLGNPVAGMSANRTTEDQAIGACVGSVCMAWRWGEMPPESNRARMGYCGKAGRP